MSRKKIGAVSYNLKVHTPLGVIDFGDILSDIGPDQSVMESAIGSFDLTSCLRQKGINDLYIAVLQNLFLLRGGFIGQKMMFSPEGISSLNESRDTMGVQLKDENLEEGLNMSPDGPLFNEGA